MASLHHAIVIFNIEGIVSIFGILGNYREKSRQTWVADDLIWLSGTFHVVVGQASFFAWL